MENNLKEHTYFGASVATTIWIHAMGRQDFVVLVQGGKAVDEPFQFLHRKILGKMVDILST
jgi:hypothetical protein